MIAIKTNLKREFRPTLGGSIFTHNAIEFDYCVEESLASLCAICDEVVVLDAQSNDGTQDKLLECATRHRNLKVFLNGKWECASNYARLAILANEARDYLKTSWHFMLQADEVIHENSFPAIRKAISMNAFTSFMVRRINLFGDLNHYLGFDIPQERKPCSDVVLRLGVKSLNAVGDAESLQDDPKTNSQEFIDKINIFHYGMVRRDVNFIEKIISMQSWFSGESSQPDQRAVDMKANGETRFDWTRFKEKNDLRKLHMEHPRFSKNWAEERQKEKIPVEESPC